MRPLRKFRRPGVVLAGVIAAAAVAAIATASTAPAPVSTNPSPLTAPCAATDAAQMSQVPSTILYRNSEVEPWVAVDPTNGNHLVGAWQQDRWNDGGANGLVSAYSTNGGTSWTEVVL